MLGEVAEHVRAEVKLLSSEERYRALTKNVAEAVMVVLAAKLGFANGKVNPMSVLLQTATET